MDGRNVFTDREQMLADQEAHEAAVLAMQAVEHGKQQGLASAAFVLGMWQGLEGSGLTRDETLAMIQAALRGR